MSASIFDSFAEHNEALHGFALRLTRNREDARDLIQDVALKIAQHQDRLDDRNHKSLLYTMTRNAFISKHRRAKSRQASINDDIAVASYTLAPPPLLPDDDARLTWRHGVSDEVQTALAQMPEEFEAALILFAQGRSYREIAATLGCQIGTVMSRLSRARGEAKKALFIAGHRGAHDFARRLGYKSAEHVPTADFAAFVDLFTEYVASN